MVAAVAGQRFIDLHGPFLLAEVLQGTSTPVAPLLLFLFLPFQAIQPLERFLPLPPPQGKAYAPFANLGGIIERSDPGEPFQRLGIVLPGQAKPQAADYPCLLRRSEFETSSQRVPGGLRTLEILYGQPLDGLDQESAGRFLIVAQTPDLQSPLRVALQLRQAGDAGLFDARELFRKIAGQRDLSVFQGKIGASANQLVIDLSSLACGLEQRIAGGRSAGARQPQLLDPLERLA